MQNKCEGFEKHVVLYAKGWYKKTNNPIHDIKVLLAKWAGLDVSDINDKNVYSMLISTFLNTMNPKANTSVYTEAIAEMIGQKWGRNDSVLSDREPYRVLLGNISICDSQHADKSIIFSDLAN